MRGLDAVGQYTHGALFQAQAWFAGWLANGGGGSGIELTPAERAHMPSPAGLLEAAGILRKQDRDAVAKGLYVRPVEWRRPVSCALHETARFFADLPKVVRRRRRHDGVEIRRHPPVSGPTRQAPPPSYALNFHYQTDGYLGSDSALLYDHQVEVLFIGTAQAMRRRLLPDLLAHLRSWPDLSSRAVLDLACGSGAFLGELGANHPRMRLIGIDRSASYLVRARERLAHHHGPTAFIEADACSIPLASASLAASSCVYLFHELPPRQRREAAGEIARTLAPGGRLFFMDSLQPGDQPGFDGLLRFFPRAFFEPYYESYLGEDLGALFGAFGLCLEKTEPVFLSRLMIFRKPAIKTKPRRRRTNG